MPDFMPLGHCFQWDLMVLWLHVVSDAVIVLSYFCIPLALVYLVRRRRDLPFHWIFWMFGIFIAGSGVSHALEIWTMWHASYLLAGVVKAITAVASAATAIMLVLLVPKAIALAPTQAEREHTPADLARQRATEELQQAQNALHQSQSQLTAIIQSAMDAIITVDEAQHIVIFNAAAEKMFGCVQSEAAGQPLDRFIPACFRAGHDEHIRRFASTGVSSQAPDTLGAIWGVRPNGEEFPVEASISQVDSGNSKLFTVILRDITERKAVGDMRERLAAVVDSSDDAIISMDLQGTITAWNHGAEKIFGHSAAEALGKPVLILFPPDQSNAGPDILARLRRGEDVQHFETVRVRKDGRLIDVSVTISPVKDCNGVTVGASKIARDITERKRAQEVLREHAVELSRSREAVEAQSRMLNLVLESMGEGLIAANREGHFLIWNDSASKLLGRGPAELSTEQWASHYDCYLPDGITRVPTDRLPLVRALHGESLQAEIIVRHPGSELGVFLEFNGRPMKDDKGGTWGGVVAFRDVTQRRVDEGEIRKLNEELEARVIDRTAALQVANHELEAFTYSVSHDLRAPLRHISGFSRILVEDFAPSLPAEAQHYLRRIEQGAARMGKLVDELLGLASVGRQILTIELTGLKSIVQAVLIELELEIAGRNVEWKIDDLPFVECDPTLIQQVFQNLVGNALKYSRPRSPAVIEIGQTKKNGETVIFVRDNGVGFNMNYVDKLFGVFQRLHRAEDFEGTGVGLATVQRIVHKHGGRVWAEAELDRGATFYFTLGSLEHSESKIAAAAKNGG